MLARGLPACSSMPAARCGLVHCPKGELFPFCKHTSLCPYALPATSPTCPHPVCPQPTSGAAPPTRRRRALCRPAGAPSTQTSPRYPTPSLPRGELAARHSTAHHLTARAACGRDAQRRWACSALRALDFACGWLCWQLGPPCLHNKPLQTCPAMCPPPCNRPAGWAWASWASSSGTSSGSARCCRTRGRCSARAVTLTRQALTAARPCLFLDTSALSGLAAGCPMSRRRSRRRWLAMVWAKGRRRPAQPPSPAGLGTAGPRPLVKQARLLPSPWRGIALRGQRRTAGCLRHLLASAGARGLAPAALARAALPEHTLPPVAHPGAPQVHHVAQISRADYMAGLEEELE